MASNRDDFTEKDKKILAQRVNYLCSYPECGQGTSGPNTEPNRASIIGVAAHITAAAPGGPRYDETMTPEDRKRIDNGIWLCENHAKLIDSDESKFATEELRKWKLVAESKAEYELNSPSKNEQSSGSKFDRMIRKSDIKPRFAFHGSRGRSNVDDRSVTLINEGKDTAALKDFEQLNGNECISVPADVSGIFCKAEQDITIGLKKMGRTDQELLGDFKLHFEDIDGNSYAQIIKFDRMNVTISPEPEEE